MGDEMMLARMIAQAEARGGDLSTIIAIAEEASEAGARRALARIGLSDEAAGADVAELRELLRAWRDAKRSAWKAAVGWVVRMLLALVLIGVAVKLGFGAWVK